MNQIKGLIEGAGRSSNRISSGHYKPKRYGWIRIAGITLRVLPIKLQYLRTMIGSLVCAEVGNDGIVTHVKRIHDRQEIDSD